MKFTKWLALAMNFTIVVTPAAIAQDVGPKPWSMTVGVDERYESNVLLTAEGEGSLGTAFHSTVGRDWSLRQSRGDITLNGNVSQLFYRELTSLNQLTFGISTGISYKITRRLSWSLADSVGQYYAQDAAVLTDQGVILPKVVTITNSASNQFSYLLSPRSQLQWALSTQRATFASSEFTDVSSVTSRLSYSHQVGKSQSLGIAQDYQRTFTEGTTGPGTILGFLGTWQWPIGKDSGLFASAGVQPYELPDVSGYHFAPTSSVSLKTHVRRTDAVSLTYAHTIEQAFGYGRTYGSYNASVSYGLNLGPSLGADFTGNYGRSTDVLTPGLGFIGRTTSASMRYAFSRNFSLSGGFSLFSRMDKPNPQVSSYRSNISLTYGKTWR